MKKYTAYCPYLSTSILVDGKVRRIEFENGTTQPYFRGGAYYTSDKSEQAAIESDSGFGKAFFLDPASAVGAEVREIENDEEVQLVSGVDGFRSAQRWLVENKDLTLEDVKNKALMQQKCKELQIEFSDYKL